MPSIGGQKSGSRGPVFGKNNPISDGIRYHIFGFCGRRVGNGKALVRCRMDVDRCLMPSIGGQKSDPRGPVFGKNSPVSDGIGYHIFGFCGRRNGEWKGFRKWVGRRV